MFVQSAPRATISKRNTRLAELGVDDFVLPVQIARKKAPVSRLKNNFWVSLKALAMVPDQLAKRWKADPPFPR